MATPTYEPIATQTLTSNQAYIDFTSIPQTYTDLRIVFTGALATGDTMAIQFNSDTGNNYSYVRLIANGSAYSSYIESSIPFIKTGAFTTTSITTPGTVLTDIMNYSNTTTYKTALNRSSDSIYVASYVGTWRNTAAITSVRVKVDSGINMLSGSTASLYGIQTAPAWAAKATGGTITSDVSYTYHTFTSSGTFTPLQNLTCDYLIVAGGGGGGNGGGGAGGYREFTAQSFTSGVGYSAVVGAGGAAQAKGSNSSFNSNPATGGGKSNASTGYGESGGSGGGDSGLTGGAGNEGGYTPVEGYAGASTSGSSTSMGGGGGAGAVGSAGSGSTGGAGGTGRYSTISGSSVARGGGGGGAGASGSGDGGVGGGGNAERGGSGGSAGAVNTGGGGGGGYYISSGAGGSGIVIVRYAN
jgi:hypothetical protein